MLTVDETMPGPKKVDALDTVAGAAGVGAVAGRRASGGSVVGAVVRTTLAPGWVERLAGGATVESGGAEATCDGARLQIPNEPGPSAGLARWIGIEARARAVRDTALRREACRWIATHQADADQDFAVAFLYASEAVELGVHDGWAMQYSTWLERVGKHNEAAAVLATGLGYVATGQQAARLHVRIARMHIRGGRDFEALGGLLEAARQWPTYAWAPQQAGELAASHGMSEAASMFVEAADRHDHNGDTEHAFDNRRRAFEVDAASESACSALAQALEVRGRFDAADTVRLTYAEAAGGAQEKLTHQMRLARGLDTGDLSRAFASVIDGVLEATSEQPHVARVDDVLLRAGLHEALAARLEWRAKECTGRQRGDLFEKLAQLYQGPLACAYRQADAWIEACAADPTDRRMAQAFPQDRPSAYDPTSLGEALVRGAMNHADLSQSTACLYQLAELAEYRLADPGLAQWACTQLVARGIDDAVVSERLERLQSRIRLQDQALAEAMELADRHESRLESLRRLSVILRGRPERTQEYLNVLQQLVRVRPQERRGWVDLIRVCARTEDFDVLEQAAEPWLQTEAPEPDAVFLRTMLITMGWRSGRMDAVIKHATALREQVPSMLLGHCHVWIAAAIQANEPLRRDALVHVSAGVGAGLGASVLAATSRLFERAGQCRRAWQLARKACAEQATCPRALWQLGQLYLRRYRYEADGAEVAVAGADSDVEAGAADDVANDEASDVAGDADRGVDPFDIVGIVEKMASTALPTSAHYRAVVGQLRHVGQHALAYVWARQWAAVRPWDVGVFEVLVQTACGCYGREVVDGASSGARSSDAGQLATTLIRAVTLPVALEAVQEHLCFGLRMLLECDRERAKQVARDLCDQFGVRLARWRKVLLHVSLVCGDYRLRARVLERWLADEAAPLSDTSLDSLPTLGSGSAQGAGNEQEKAAKTSDLSEPQQLVDGARGHVASCNGAWEDRGEVWLVLSRLYREMQEPEAYSKCLERAAQLGYKPEQVLELAQTPVLSTSADVAICLAHARALSWQQLALRRVTDSHAMQQARYNWLRLGALRWQRAHDPIGAISAWIEAYGSDCEGFAMLSQALCVSKGPQPTIEALELYAMQCSSPSMQASACVVAAALAYRQGQMSIALQLALDALAADPRRTDALLVVDMASSHDAGAEAIDRAHWLASAGAKGRFGRKSAHLRASRALQNRGFARLALTHAIAAFEADPVQGAAFQTMSELASTTDPSAVIQVLSRVAEQFESPSNGQESSTGSRADAAAGGGGLGEHRVPAFPEQASQWWMCASQIASRHPTHLAQAVQLCVRALVVEPSVDKIKQVGDLMGQVVQQGAEQLGNMQGQLRSLFEQLQNTLEGPVGARIAICGAVIAAQRLQMPEHGMQWATLALGYSGDIDEYTQLVQHAALFAQDEAAADAFISEVLARQSGVRGTTGAALFAFAIALSQSMGDTDRTQALRHMLNGCGMLDLDRSSEPAI